MGQPSRTEFLPIGYNSNRSTEGDILMAEKVLRGSRLGAVSYETDRDHDLAPRRIAKYRTPNGEEFDVQFADEAEIPQVWTCKNGQDGELVDGNNKDVTEAKHVRSHWDMLLERRTKKELEDLLNDRLKSLQEKRGRL